MPPRLPPRLPPRCLCTSNPTSNLLYTPSSSSSSLPSRLPVSRAFSSTPHPLTRLRRDMWRWLNGPGAVFHDPLPGSTNYLNAYNERGTLIRSYESDRDNSKNGNSKDNNSNSGGNDTKNHDAGDESITDVPGAARTGEASVDVTMNMEGARPLPPESLDDLIPFPLNRQFRSQPVLSDALREEIDRRVVEAGESVRIVSIELGVEMSRVAAVVRLKAVEREWIKQNKTLATPYATAILAMLPQTPFNPDASFPQTHESINDLPVHRATQRQLFQPTSESRRFARTDAAAAFFEPGLLPADDRIPHPTLITTQRPINGRTLMREHRTRALRTAAALETADLAAQSTRRADRVAAETVRVLPDGGRWEFRFRNVSVEDAGPDGRGRKGVGARYGFPHEDRKRAQIKIPTRVD